MATKHLVSVEEYLHTSFEHDAEYVEARLVYRPEPKKSPESPPTRRRLTNLARGPKRAHTIVNAGRMSPSICLTIR